MLLLALPELYSTPSASQQQHRTVRWTPPLPSPSASPLRSWTDPPILCLLSSVCVCLHFFLRRLGSSPASPPVCFLLRQMTRVLRWVLDLGDFGPASFWAVKFTAGSGTLVLFFPFARRVQAKYTNTPFSQCCQRLFASPAISQRQHRGIGLDVPNLYIPL